MELLHPFSHKLLLCLSLAISFCSQSVNSDGPPPQLFLLHVTGLASNILVLPNSTITANKQSPSLYNLFSVQFHRLDHQNSDIGLKMTLQSVATQRYVCMNSTGHVYPWKPRGRGGKKPVSRANGCPLLTPLPKRSMDTNDVIKTKVRHHQPHLRHNPVPEDCYFLFQRLPADIANSADALVSVKYSTYNGTGRYLRFKKNGQPKGVKLPFPLTQQKHRRGIDIQLLPDPNITKLIQATTFKSTKRYDFRVRTCLYKKHLNKAIFAPKFLSNDKISQVINKCRCIAFNAQPTMSNSISKRHI